jgi:peptidyl-prolyl cis-trans isomerase C
VTIHAARPNRHRAAGRDIRGAAHTVAAAASRSELVRNASRILAFAALISAFALPVAAQDAIIAKVNGKAITEGDMKFAEAEIGGDLGTLPETTKRRVLVEFLIENQLFADQADKLKLGSGANYDERMQYWRRRTLRDVFFDKTFKDSVSEDEAKKFFDQQVGAMKPREEIRARHILVQSKDEAVEVYEKLQHGGDFAALAKEYSKDPGSKDQGGELGFFSRGQMVPKFEEAAFKLKKGEVSEPFETQFGWHVVKIDDRREQPAPSFDAVKDRVRAAIIHRKAEQAAADLRRQATIEYVDPAIKKSVDEDSAAAGKK